MKLTQQTYAFGVQPDPEYIPFKKCYKYKVQWPRGNAQEKTPAAAALRYAQKRLEFKFQPQPRYHTVQEMCSLGFWCFLVFPYGIIKKKKGG